MSMGDKNRVVSAKDLPGKKTGFDAEKHKETTSELPQPRIVDDKLIGDDRDLQDAMEKRESDERDPACENNYWPAGPQSVRSIKLKS